MNLTPLKKWFLANRRDLPWRNNPTPYQVWVSEIMLQQTQVKVVIPYYQKWMLKYPTIQSLAEAPVDEVIKLWEGLGYYSRARNLHAGARQVVERFSGQLPNDKDELAEIKGLGPYTVGAILSFAFHQNAPAVDGNVQRVIARLFHMTDDFSKGESAKKVWKIAEEILPEEEPWIINEALIELGATICTRVPQCKQCPLRSSCQSYARGDAAALPYKSKKTKIESLYRTVAVILNKGHLLVRKGEKGAIMSDLHEFPYFECSPNPELPQILKEKLPFNFKNMRILPVITHSFTRYQATLYPASIETLEQHPFPNHRWIHLDTIPTLAFSSGHRRILDAFLSLQN